MTRCHRILAEGLREGSYSDLSWEDTRPLSALVQRMGAAASAVSPALVLLSLVPLFERGRQLLTLFRWEEFTLTTAVLATCPMWN